MLNTRELEKRWLHYKIKSYIPHAVITASLLIIGTVILILLSAQEKKETPSIADINQTKERTKVVQKQKTVQVQTLPKAELQTEEIQKTVLQEQNTINTITQTPIVNQTTKLTLTPSMGFMKHIQNEEQQPYYKSLHQSPAPTKEKVLKKRNKITQTQNKVEEEYIDIQQSKPKTIIKTQEPEKRKIITIERRDSQKDIKEIISRFKKNNNPALSLFVAKKYYELGNYEQAYNYALITNGINNDIEESWLIFAKSLVKLHKRDMAIKTLAEYIKYSHSGNARILLDDIRSGKFK